MFGKDTVAGEVYERERVVWELQSEFEIIGSVGFIGNFRGYIWNEDGVSLAVGYFMGLEELD